VAARGPDEEAPSRRPGHIVQIGKQTLVYGLSGVSLQLVGLITLPIFTRVFSPSEYGVLELATVGSSVAVTLVDAGMTSASQRSFYDYDDSRIESRRSVISTALLFSSTLAFLCAIVVILARDPISLWLFDGEKHDTLVIAIAVSLPLINAANLALVTQDLSYQPWLAGRYTLPAGMTQTMVIGQSGPEVSSWQRGLHVGNGSRIEVMAELTDYRPMTVDRLAILAYFGSNSTAKPTSGPTQPATTYEVEVWNYARDRYDKVTLTTGVARDLASPGDYISPDGYVRLAIEAAAGSWFDAQRIGFTVAGREVR
jgi:hypothetical protein